MEKICFNKMNLFILYFELNTKKHKYTEGIQTFSYSSMLSRKYIANGLLTQIFLLHL